MSQPGKPGIPGADHHGSTRGGSTPTGSIPTGSIPPGSSPRVVLFITTAASFCTSFAASSVSVALPAISLDFSLGGVALGWVVTAFVLTSAALVMPMGRLGDIYGRQRIFFLGMCIYLASSAAAAFAPGAVFLLISRGLTGIGAAMAFATVTAVLVASFPPNQRGRVLGINVAMVYAGLSLGPVLGGFIVQALGWRALFGFHALVSLVVVVLVIALLKGNHKEAHRGRFDLLGAILYVAALALLLSGVSDLPHLRGLVLTAGALVVLGIFLGWESRNDHPILPVSLFTRNRVFAFSNLAAMISYSATFSVTFFVSLHLQVVNGLAPASAGLVLVVQPVIQAVFSPLTGRLSDRVSPRLLSSLGMGLTSLGLAVLALADQNSPLGLIVGALVLLGLGFALFSSPNTNSIMGSVEKKDLGLASATVATMRVLGQMLSMALALVLLALFMGEHKVDTTTVEPFILVQRAAFGISAVLCAAGVLASLSRGKAVARPDGAGPA